jgi:hypothetical protein
MLVGLAAVAWAADGSATREVEPLWAPTARTSTAAPPAPYDPSLPPAPSSVEPPAPPPATSLVEAPADAPRRHYYLLWLWGGIAALLIASIVVTEQARSTPQPIYGNANDRVFP